MHSENNCKCVVCNVEAVLLGSFSTQTARTHFKALARNYPALSHFMLPTDLLAHLRDRREAVTHDSGNQILHSLIHAVSDKSFEELGQQLLLVAFTPAIHKIYREICQRFPMVYPDDVAQQTWVAFIETTKSPAIPRQNGQLPVALVMNCRKAMLRWAAREARRLSIVRHGFEQFSEPACEDKFEGVVLLEDLLRQAQLSQAESQLLLKFKWEGMGAKALAQDDGYSTANAMHSRLKRILKRLRRIAQACQSPETGNAPNQKNIFPEAANFCGEVPFSTSEKGFSPKLPRPASQLEADVPQFAAGYQIASKRGTEVTL